MTELISTIVQGILIGGLYALFAAGLSLVFGIMRVVNLAHGDLIVAGSFVGFACVNTLGLHPMFALLLTPVVMAGAGYALQRTILNPTIGQDILPPLLVTFGVSIILQNALLQLFSADNRKISLGGLETSSLKIGEGIAVGWYSVIVFICSILVIFGLQMISNRTRIGRAFRAAADDADIARLMGVRTSHVFGLAMALALAICGIAGVLFAIWTSFTPLSGPGRLLIAFEVIVIGGIGSIWGTLIGGIVLGLAQAIGGYFNPGWQTLAGHIAFIAILMYWPRGLWMGRRK